MLLRLMRRTGLGVILVTLISAAFVVGCESGDDPETPSASPAPTASAVSTPTPTPEGPGILTPQPDVSIVIQPETVISAGDRHTCALPPGGTPVSERLSGEVLSLPMHPYLTEEAQQQVVDAVRGAAQPA